jgi:hypothetical protein
MVMFWFVLTDGDVLVCAVVVVVVVGCVGYGFCRECLLVMMMVMVFVFAANK